MVPVTRELWNELIHTAEQNPHNGCGRRALHLALVMKAVEEHETLLIIQFCPTVELLVFAPWKGQTWRTHYAVFRDHTVYDPALGTPLPLPDYLQKAFPGQEVNMHYYHPTPETAFTPNNALSIDDLFEMTTNKKESS